jgi:hypothetical protein
MAKKMSVFSPHDFNQMSVFNFSYIPVFYDGILEEKKLLD